MDYTVRLFLSGDYEFLCRKYGLSGASGRCSIIKTMNVEANSTVNVGRHNCLWCHIPGSMLKVPPSQRKSYQPRSLDTLKHDHARFLSEAHGDLKQAKNYNNVIGDIMFEIPIDQVRLINKLKI